MNPVMPLTLLWVASGAAIAFLFACTVHNRRTGYRKTRVQESGVRDALALLRAFRAYLSEEPTGAPSVSAEPLTAGAAVSGSLPMAAEHAPELLMAQPLLSLSSAVGGSKQPATETPASPRPLAGSSSEVAEEVIVGKGPQAISVNR